MQLSVQACLKSSSPPVSPSPPLPLLYLHRVCTHWSYTPACQGRAASADSRLSLIYSPIKTSLLPGQNPMTKILRIKCEASCLPLRKEQQDRTCPETSWTLVGREKWNFSTHTSFRKYAREDIPVLKYQGRANGSLGKFDRHEKPLTGPLWPLVLAHQTPGSGVTPVNCCLPMGPGVREHG